MKNAVTLTMVIAVWMLSLGWATADWVPNTPSDPLNSTNHKMHYPQLVDPGWEVKSTAPLVLADDWQCSEAGPVSGIHFWCSSRQDEPFQIQNIHVSIYGNLEVDQPGNPLPYSIPTDEPLWSRDFGTGEFQLSGPLPTFMPEWYDPSTGLDVPADHWYYYQVNIMGIDEPFTQSEGEVYWLALSMTASGLTDAPPELGWMTSSSPPFMDRPVFRDSTSPEMAWTPAWGVPGESATGPDLAFVITPEPSTLVMLLVAGLMGLVTCVRRRT
jgi:hypothetical protein